MADVIVEELLPCPFCGEGSPFTYISFSCAVLRCRCGSEMEGGAVRVMYKRDELPEELKPHSYEPTLLVMRQGDKEIRYPDHGYVGVNAIAAFGHAGVTAKWNRRTTIKVENQ